MQSKLCDKQDPTGSDRHIDRDKGKASAGKSTLNRLELGAVTTDRYKKIAPNMEAIDELLLSSERSHLHLIIRATEDGANCNGKDVKKFMSLISMASWIGKISKDLKGVLGLVFVIARLT